MKNNSLILISCSAITFLISTSAIADGTADSYCYFYNKTSAPISLQYYDQHCVHNGTVYIGGVRINEGSKGQFVSIDSNSNKKIVFSSDQGGGVYRCGVSDHRVGVSIYYNGKSIGKIDCYSDSTSNDQALNKSAPGGYSLSNEGNKFILNDLD